MRMLQCVMAVPMPVFATRRYRFVVFVVFVLMVFVVAMLVFVRHWLVLM